MPKSRNALGYLLKTKIKNQLKQLVRKPARLIYFIFLIAILVFVIFAGNASGVTGNGDIRELGAIIFALYFAMIGLIGYGGFSNGGSFFRMSDVNLLFPAPIKQQSVLFYGLAQQLGTALLMGFFILFQYAWMNSRYGIGYGYLLIIMLMYGIMMLSGQLISMIEYAFTAGNDQKKRRGKTVFLAILAVTAAAILAKTYMGGDMSFGSLSINAYNIGRFFPVAGWLAASVTELIAGNIAAAAAFLAATLAFDGVILVIFLRSSPDYYEDVLASAEKFQSVLAAQSEGLQQDVTPQNIKVGKSGLGGGNGASAFYYKHLLENRRAKAGFIGMNSLIFIVVSLVYAFIMKKSMDGESESVALAITIGFSTYMQMFSSGFGRLPAELSKPFIYLVPEPSESKLIQSLREGLIRYLIESALFTAGIALIFGLQPLTIFAVFALRFSTNLLFLGANLLFSRIFGMKKSKGMSMFLFFLIGLLLMVPGVGGGIAAVLLVAANVTAFCLAMAVVNFAVTAVVIILCRRMLDNAECNA